MDITSSYGIQLKGLYYREYQGTVRIYRDAVSYLVSVCLDTYHEWKDLRSHEAQLYIIHQVHSRKNHPARFPEFDKRFHKFPSELRKDAVTKAMGIVKAYRSELQNWEDNGRSGRQPVLNHNQCVMPCLFNRDMYKRLDEGTCQIKLFLKKDWVWKTLKLDKSDVRYVQKHCANLSESAPTLEMRMHKVYLRFSYEGSYSLPDVESCSSDKKNTSYVVPDAVCAVDLGVNTDATCSIVRRDGTVTARKFISFPVEKDHLYHILDDIKSSQRMGNHINRRLWRFADNYNTEISIKTACAIIDFAKANEVPVIVMENLRIKGKARGSKKQRLHLWRKREIIARVEAMAHRNGMRLRTVCAWNTSRLAFDGSGRVKRGKESAWTSGNYSLCEFQGAAEGSAHGKIYNCDLSASYNIGARYLTRVILNSIPATEWCALRAKVPEAFKRTPEGESQNARAEQSSVRVTLSTLINLNRALASPDAGAQLCAISVEGKSASRKGRSVA